MVDGGVFTGEGEFGIIYSRFRVRSEISGRRRSVGRLVGIDGTIPVI